MFPAPQRRRAARLRPGRPPARRRAAEHGLNYVALEGDIGCIINGAGLAMATMDMIQHAGGEAPRTSSTIGGGASPDRVAAAFRLVLTDKKVARHSW